MASQIASLQRAVPTINQACQFVRRLLRPGISEQSVSDALVTFLRDKGFSRLAFPPIIAFGSNAAYPHHKPGRRKLRPHTIVLLDFGFKINGWCTDLTRTYFFGRPDPVFTKRYQLVLRAQRAAINTLMTSRNGNEIDAAARTIISNAGYGKQFRHSTGHGVGTRIHQPPWISSARKRNITLATNDVVTIEPGVYSKGWGGIRIEDMVVVGTSPRVLTATISKNPIVSL